MLGFLDRTAAMVATVPAAVLAPQVASWVPNNALEQIAWSDVLGLACPALTRAEAMMVPAVARARHLTAGTIARLPLQVLAGAELVDPQPSWCSATDGQLGLAAPAPAAGQSPWWRMLWTVDDLLFYGRSLWRVTSADPDGRPLRMVRVPIDAWTVTEDGTVVDADGRPYPAALVRYLPGPHEGLLTYGRRTIRTAARLEASVADVAEHPFRIELHQTSEASLTGPERRELVAEARAALATNDGVLFTNSALETVEHRMDSGQLLVEGRNASAVDVARAVSMPAAMLDATAATASLTYVTLAGRNQEWIDYGLSMYLDAVTARLGMDDVVPRGQRVAFDLTELTALAPAPTGAPTAD